MYPCIMYCKIIHKAIFISRKVEAWGINEYCWVY